MYPQPVKYDFRFFQAQTFAVSNCHKTHWIPTEYHGEPYLIS